MCYHNTPTAFAVEFTVALMVTLLWLLNMCFCCFGFFQSGSHKLNISMHTTISHQVVCMKLWVLAIHPSGFICSWRLQPHSRSDLGAETLLAGCRSHQPTKISLQTKMLSHSPGLKFDNCSWHSNLTPTWHHLSTVPLYGFHMWSFYVDFQVHQVLHLPPPHTSDLSASLREFYSQLRLRRDRLPNGM